MAVLCPECETPVTVEADEVHEGEVVVCEDCGAELEIVSLDPLKIEPVDASGYDDPEETGYAAAEGDEEE